jgi:formamidase
MLSISILSTVSLTTPRIAGTQTVRPSLPNYHHPNLTYSVVPFCGTIKNNEVVKIECLDWTGGQIKNNDSADDVKNVDLTQVHYLSGPFEIETAEPGDILLVEIQDVQPFQDQPWGFTGVFAKENGGGFLDEIYPNPYVFLLGWSFRTGRIGRG